MRRIKSKLQANIGMISKIRYQITPTVVINLFQSMMLSHLRYCNITWCYGNFIIRTSLQAQCNKFLRAGFRLDRRECVKYIMDIYKLPSLNELSFIQLAVTMHKINLNALPTQFSTFFASARHNYSTSSTSASRFVPTFHRFETTKQAISYRACKTWTSLPTSVKFTPASASNNNSHQVQAYRPIKQFVHLLKLLCHDIIGL